MASLYTSLCNAWQRFAEARYGIFQGLLQVGGNIFALRRRPVAKASMASAPTSMRSPDFSASTETMSARISPAASTSSRVPPLEKACVSSSTQPMARVNGAAQPLVRALIDGNAKGRYAVFQQLQAALHGFIPLLGLFGERDILIPCGIGNVKRLRKHIAGAGSAQQGVAHTDVGKADIVQRFDGTAALIVDAGKALNKGKNGLPGVLLECLPNSSPVMPATSEKSVRAAPPLRHGQ